MMRNRASRPRSEAASSSDYPSLFFDVVVIADNCTDQPPPSPREAGARVVERFDDKKKSKGYAIEYLLESLDRSGELSCSTRWSSSMPTRRSILDLLRSFDDALRRGHDWIQAYYTVANPDQSWRTRLMTYAFSLFNGVMQLGQNALGSSAGFKGNGMCFSTRGLSRRPWRCYGLVEDMEFSWTIRVAGEKDLVPARARSLWCDARLRAVTRRPSNADAGSSAVPTSGKIISDLCCAQTT